MIRFSRLPIRVQLMSLAILLTLPAIGLIVYSGLKERTEAYRKAEIETQRLTDNLAAELENIVTDAKQLCRILAKLPEVRSRKPAALQPILSAIIKDDTQYLNIIFADANGLIWGATHPFSQGERVSERRYFRSAHDTLTYSVGEYVVSKTTQKPALHVAYPIMDDHGRFQGVAIVGFDLDSLRSVLERSQLSKNANYVLTDYKGIILCRGRTSGRDVGESIEPVELKKMQEGADRDTYEFVRDDGDRRIITYRKLRLSGEQVPYAYVRAGLSIKEAVSAANRKLFSNMAILLSCAFLAFVLAVFIGKRSIVDRVTTLQAASKQIIEGNLSARVAPAVEGGELGELGLAFDEMAHVLEDKINTLIHAQSELRDKAVLLEVEVTERRNAQEKLAVKQEQLEMLNATLEERVAYGVDELRKKDQALIQQNRLAAMGEMIGNIAHQWRHPLHNIGLLVQILPSEAKELSKEQLEQQVAKIMDLIMQMSQTIDDFIGFFRQDKEKSRFVVNTTVVRAVELNRPSLDSKGIKLLVFGDQEVSVYGYANEYMQVLLNIISNAKDVLVQRAVKDPLISISIERDNERSVVTISDNGGGIEEAILSKIFDPYFTTKGPTLGTGIGLYMSKMIIEKNMGGSLTVRNSDYGAEFRIEI